MGRHPRDSPDRTQIKRPKGRDDPLEVLIDEAVAMRNAKILRMELVRAYNPDFDDIEDKVYPPWPVVWWDDCSFQFHSKDLGIGWDDESGRQQMELLYACGDSSAPENKYFVGHRESCTDMYIEAEDY